MAAETAHPNEHRYPLLRSKVDLRSDAYAQNREQNLAQLEQVGAGASSFRGSASSASSIGTAPSSSCAPWRGTTCPASRAGRPWWVASAWSAASSA
jgi:hypothetical protein